ncbi:MAG: hypothetical protein E4H27_10430 [Anaerolineales bacterium]|jgi:hypothetical protein|nr:MAG: hypothetical protein E4H27_10430 [Anaerolineales bacterium]
MNIEQAMTDPTRAFSNPGEVINEQSLTRDQKIKILTQWEYDARELEVAEEENMGGGPPSVLDEILKALHCLDSHADKEHSPPTKHGDV